MTNKINNYILKNIILKYKHLFINYYQNLFIDHDYNDANKNINRINSLQIKQEPI